MKQFIAILFLLATAVGLMADETDRAVYRLNVQPFVELTVVDGVAVDYRQNTDSIGWAVFECRPEMAAQIMFSNNAERLTIRTAADEVPIVGVPHVTVYSAALHKVENSGDSLLRVFATPHVHADEFKAKQIGNGRIEIHGINATYFEAGVTAGRGTITVDGMASKARLSNVGTGSVDARDLMAENINCFVFSTGSIDCSPSGRLRIYGAGSGKVFYHVEPEKITNRGIGVKAHSAVENKEDNTASDK